MFRELILLFHIFLGVRALVCPATGYYPDAGDGSCSSMVSNGKTRSDAYVSCAQENSYLPIILNAFQNAGLQNITKQGTFWDPLPGMWLGLTCTGNVKTSCSWDDGTPMTSSSYSNFAPRSPNATMGPCVYQDVATGYWLSDSCSSRTDMGYFCKFKPTNNVPMCSQINSGRSTFASPDYFTGNCYYIYDYNNDVKNVTDAERLCNNNCGHLVSIHSEGENSFVRDIMLKLWLFDKYAERCYLGVRDGGAQWSDGSPVNYTNYGANSIETPNWCSFMVIKGNKAAPGFWYTSSCFQTQIPYVVCKKSLLNDCDAPRVPFPTSTPTVCSNGPYHLNMSGTVYPPGSPYYPYGSQPNQCEYIQKVEEGLHPSITAYFTKTKNFIPGSSVSIFAVYSSEDPSVAPIYSFNGSSFSSLFTLTSPTTVLRSVYSTTGDSTVTSDWREMDYSSTQILRCSFVLDYSYLGFYNQTADNTYFHQGYMASGLTYDLPNSYRSTNCVLDFAVNSAAYGNVNPADSFITPANYSNTANVLIQSTGNSFVDLCTFIDQLNAYTVPAGTENSCLIFFSGRSAQDFAACRPVQTKKFKYTFGVAINGQTGVSSFTSNVVNLTNIEDDREVLKLITNTIMPPSCK